MTVVGEASVLLKIVGDDVARQIRAELQKAAGVAEKEGASTARAFSEGFERQGRRGFLNKIFNQRFFEDAERARRRFVILNRVFTLLLPTIVGVGGAIGALGGGLITLGALLGNAARSSIVLVAALGALGQAALVTAIAFRGVGDAISAGLQAQRGGASAARNEEAALRRLRDARLALRDLIEKEKPEALAQARERAAEAADAAADAVLGAERAERAYFDAQKAVLEAQEDLNDAREEAKERLQQLRFEVEGAAISEKRARLEFERARESLQRVQDLPPNSRARQEAELAFAEADLNLRRAIDRNSDLKKEEDAATRAGVEGSDLVVGAKERLANAQQAETDAALDAARAFRDAAKAQERAAQAAADAASGGRVEQELDARIARAREAVRDAEQALADAAAGGVDAFAEALAKLSPSAQEFVRTIIENEKAFNDFKKTVQEPFFQEFNRSLFLLLERLPALGQLFAGTSRIVGRLASGFVDLFLGAENFDRTQRIWKTNDQLIENLGNTFLNLTDGLLLLLDAAEPVIKAFGEWAEQSSAGWVARLKEDFAGVRNTIEQAAEKAARIFGILGTIGDIFGVIGAEINESGGAADFFLGWLEDLTNNGLKALQEEADSGNLKQFFLDATENATLVLEILGDILLGLLKLGAAPGTKQFLESIRNVTRDFSGLNEEGVSFADTFGAKDGPLAAIGEFIEELFTTFGLLLENESFTIFIDTLTDSLRGLNDFLRKESTQAFLEAVAPFFGFFLALGLIFDTIKEIFLIFAGFFIMLGGGADNVFPKFTGLFGFFKEGGPLKQGVMKLGGSFLRIFGIVGLIIGALIAMWQNSAALREGVRTLFETLGTAFMQVWESLQPAFQEASVFFVVIGDIFSTVFDLLGRVFGAIGDWVAGFLPALGSLWSGVIGAVGGIVEMIAGLFTFLGGAFQVVWGVIKGLLLTLVALFTGEWDKVGEAFSMVWDGVVNMFKGGVRIIVGLVRTIVNAIIGVYNTIADITAFTLPDWLGGYSFSLPKASLMGPIPLNFAQGGIVRPSPGGTIARIGEAGQSERVEPLDSSGLSKRDRAMISMLAGNGPTINVYPSPGMNEAELARKISREMASQMRRGGV